MLCGPLRVHVWLHVRLRKVAVCIFFIDDHNCTANEIHLNVEIVSALKWDDMVTNLHGAFK